MQDFFVCDFLAPVPKHDLASMVAHTHAWHVATGGRDFDWAYEDALLAEIG